MVSVYAFMFFSYPERSVSFVEEISATSNILMASFVFKYSVISLAASLLLPVILPLLVETWSSFEEKRLSKIQN